MLPKLPPPTRVEFTSLVDAEGYDLIPDQTPPLAGKTWKDLQTWLEQTTTSDIQPARIRGRGGKQTAVRLDHHPALYSEFASVKTAEELLVFVTQYGPLTSAGTAHGAGDVVVYLLDQAERMRKTFKPRHPIEIDGSLTDLKAWLVTDKKRGTVAIKIGPSTLLAGLWLQLGRALSGGAKMKQCKHCTQWFPIGGDSGKRLTAQFCTEEHKKKFFSLERSR